MASPFAPSPDDEPRTKKPYVSPWVPVSLLVITTAALAVPLVMLRRHQKGASTSGALGRILDGASAPPPRRATVRVPGASSSGPSSHTLSSAPPPRRVSRSSAAAIPAFVSRAPKTLPTSPPKPSAASSSRSKAAEPDDLFNAPLYTLKAFSIATGLVVVGGVATVWEVKTYLGVRDTKEFAARMRYTLLTSMPFLASRIHRPPSSEPLPPTSPFSSPDTSEAPSASSATSPEMSEPWSWSAAQARLSKAYEAGGIAGWMEAAAVEMEMEADIERRKRGVWVDARAPAGENMASSR
ncbi:hypothetical protein DENSPDRAFT_828761 [Dentipellis sp. KUC8613]|nr:hypothetical protein DENSPDRAFT_828761 [Dentipellis sp. KUC8613]